MQIKWHSTDKQAFREVDANYFSPSFSTRSYLFFDSDAQNCYKHEDICLAVSNKLRNNNKVILIPLSFFSEIFMSYTAPY